MSSALVFWLIMCCAQYGVDPAFALAVAQIESGDKHHEYRLGVIGREKEVAGPMGLHIAYVREKFREDARDPMVNIRIGVRALKGKNLLHVLRRYNRESNRAYERAVMVKMKELRGK